MYEARHALAPSFGKAAQIKAPTEVRREIGLESLRSDFMAQRSLAIVFVHENELRLMLCHVAFMDLGKCSND